MAINRSLLIGLFAICGTHCAPAPSTEVDSSSVTKRSDLDTAQLLQIEKLQDQTVETVVSHMLKSCYCLQVSGIPPAQEIAAANAGQNLAESPFLQETAATLARNLQVLSELGCLDDDGLEKLRNGQPPLMRSGLAQGSAVSILRTISPSKVPDLANQVFNLEMTDDLSLTETPPERQLEFARRWHWQELLDDRDYAAVVYTFPSQNSQK
ncbi:MAG: hypothetical protein ACI9R3_003758 [Verrucomicrobiales bacterium]|jgi:hypothetical protein